MKRVSVATPARCSAREEKLVIDAINRFVHLTACSGIDVACRRGRIVVTAVCPTRKEVASFKKTSKQYVRERHETALGRVKHKLR